VEPDRRIGIAFARTVPDRLEETEESSTENGAALEITGSTGALGESTVESGDAPMAGSSVAPPLDLEGILADAIAAPKGSPSGLAADAGSLDKRGPSGPLGGSSGSNAPKKKVALFGTEGYGHRFAYVIDRSESMNSPRGRPLAAAKRELLKSIHSLGPDEEFQVIFYNDRAIPLRRGAGNDLLTGDRTSVSFVDQAVGLMTAGGGTNHLEALKLAMRWKPDVVFFLTDARYPGLGRYQINELLARAQSNKTTIHTIEFGTDVGTPDESFLIDLARGSGGTYRYYNASEL
jgi:hypothetical protein